MNREELKQELSRLSDDNNFPNKKDKTDRGRLFEKLINKLLHLENLEPNSGFRPSGEEIDGSFILNSRVFLFEAKWHKLEIPASSIYQFKGKIDGKLLGTLGIFLSMSGFSSEAVDALTFGKSINIILFDFEDFQTAINEEYGFTKVLERKIRIATEKGNPFFPVKSLNIDSKPLNHHPNVLISTENVSNIFTNDITNTEERLLIIVEGSSDRQIIASFAEKVLSEHEVKKLVEIIVAGGKYSVAKLANTIKENLDNNTKLVLIADGDDDEDGTERLLMSALNTTDDISFIIPNPNIEVWLLDDNNLNHRQIRSNARTAGLEVENYLSNLIRNVDIAQLISINSSFEKLYKELIS